MNAVTTNNKYTQWLNSLPVAKNMAGLTPERAGTVSGNVSHNGDYVNMDKILYSGEKTQSAIKNYSGMPITEYELFPSSEREYTVMDAVQYQYNREFTIKLDDIMNGNYENIKLREPGSAVPESFIEGLRQNGIPEGSYDTFRTDFYLNGLSDSADIEHAVEYLASGYAVAKRHIEDNFSGGEMEAQLERLSRSFQEAVEKRARDTANELGGFLDDNGTQGQTGKIYDSVIKAYEDKTRKYSEFIENNRDYANLEGTENEWLMKDDSYMACQLRKASDVKDLQEEETISSQYYTLGELGKAKVMVDEIKKYLPGASGDRAISSNATEEEIGLKLAELSMKGEVFIRYSGVSQALKDAVIESIRHIVKEMPARLNRMLEKERGRTASPELHGDLDAESIRLVYEKVMSSWPSHKDMVKALKEGMAFGKQQHDMKVASGSCLELARYGSKGSGFWINFYKIAQNTENGSDSLKNLTLDFGYAEKKTGFEALAQSWNRFVSKYTDDPGILFSEDSFFAYA